MTLTNTQFKSLKLCMRWHRDSLTLGTLVRSCMVSWLALLFAAGLGGLLIAFGITSVGWFCVGMCAGAFLRDIGRFRILIHVWPVNSEITNWERAEELIQAHESLAVKE